MDKDLTELLAKLKQDISAADTEYELNNVKSQALGKKSVVTNMMKRLGSLSPEERPEFGKKINELKKELENLISIRAEEIAENKYRTALIQEKVDLTLPGYVPEIGGLHPLTQVWREIEDIFMSLGFDVVEGYDIEDEFHNFTALNTPEGHPARNEMDTFYLKTDSSKYDANRLLLRSQTSTVQVRTMEGNKPPIRIISIGRCYRNDKPDASHSPFFHQVEALCVDKGVTFADLRDMLNSFAKKMFGSQVKSRFRPHFFPFTEPSAEFDLVCFNCYGKGCNVCKQSGWIEIGGSGMVDPNVFDTLGIDSEKYTGYAFGLGIDRIALLKYRLPDIRLLFENDYRLLKQFG
ncbi:MAG: phenylalanine--tRNA ligase subunit alpha [Candidatus Cloacimonadia bacterium]